MEDMPLGDRRILEALEACRPGSDDLSDPEMERLAAAMAGSPELDDLYERSQRVDVALGAAFRDVPVPEGLEDRLLARLSAAEARGASESEGGSAGAAPAPSAAIVAPASARSPRVSRRLLLICASLAAALLIAVVGLLMVGRSDRRGTGPIELSEAIDRFEADRQADHWGTGEPIETAPADYPFSPWVVQYAGITWRRPGERFGGDSVAFDIPGSPGALATLYVVRRAAPNLPSAPDFSNPSFATANVAVVAWQEGDLAYLLVVEGGEREYLKFLNRRAEGPLA